MNGLRERKKAETRQAISDVATRLFEARGFEAVTVAEIAAAANVSAKTVFNYFPAKEDLFFDAKDASATPSGRLPDVRPLLLDGPLLARSNGLGRLPRRALRAHAHLDRHRARLPRPARPPARHHQLLGGPARHRERLSGWAAMLVGLINLRNETFAQGLLAERSPRAIQRHLRATLGPPLAVLLSPPFR